jgi:hypothetical protein
MANLILVSYIKNIILYVDIKNVICICNKTEMIKVIVSLIQLIETLYIYIYQVQILNWYSIYFP